MAEGRVDGIICFGVDTLGHDVKRPYQLMLQLRTRVPVVYVEPDLSLTSVLKNWRVALSAPWRARMRRSVLNHADEIAPGLHVVGSSILTPLNRLSSLLSAERLDAVGRRQFHRAARRAFRIAEKAGISSAAVWATYPVPLSPLFDDGRTALVVYDCIDRWSEFPHAVADPTFRAVIVRTEQQLFERADLVLCSALGLLEHAKRSTDAPVVLVRNGADVDHFAPRGRPRPEDLRTIPGPLIGYVGALADWFDFEIVREAATSRPDWSFVLIGPVFGTKNSGDARALELVRHLENVHLLGARAYDALPAYLEYFDVATIPFKVNGLTEDTNPIKLYEYLAAGLPVVSTQLPEVQGVYGARVAGSADEFVAACEAALGERWDPEAIARRRAAAAGDSWAQRADSAWAAIERSACGEGRSATG